MIIEATRTHGLRVTLCANAETVTDGLDLDPWADEATREAVSAARRAMEKVHPQAYFADDDSHFPNWHGGKHAGRNLGFGRCYISAVVRDIEADDDGDETEGDWRWIADADAPAEVKELAARLADAANTAYAASLDTREAEIANERKTA